MKKKGILLAYCIPWIFLALYADAQCGWGWQYAAVLVCMAGIPAAGAESLGVLLAGNGLSLGVSLVLVHLTGFSGWNAYFKPFGADGWVLALSGISWLAQWLIWKKQWLILGILTAVAGAFIATAYWLQISM